MEQKPDTEIGLTLLEDQEQMHRYYISYMKMLFTLPQGQGPTSEQCDDLYLKSLQ